MFASRLILFYGLSFTQTIFALNSGNVCTIEGTSRQGICTNLKKCPTITYGVLNQKQPTVCGIEGEQRFVCCPDPIQEITTKRYTSENSLSQQKCQEYSAKIGQCDHKSNQLTFNNQANPKEFPHMAIIGFESDGHIMWSCVGTLISDEYVLTAALCLRWHTSPPKYIRLGDLDIESDSDDAKPETFNVTQIIPHPNYRLPLAHHDIGLLRMDRKVKFSQYIHPACLATTSDSPDTETTVSGWGVTQIGGKYSSHMLKFRVSEIGPKNCDDLLDQLYQIRVNDLTIEDAIKDAIKDVWESIRIQEKSHICGLTIGGEFCQRHSGAPLQIGHSSLPCIQTVIGISSYGFECGRSYPSVFTKVVKYIGWIESIVWNK